MASILFAGDFCPYGRIPEIIELGNYGVLFDNIKDIVADADYSVVNFETTIANPQVDKQIEKCGPALCTTEKAVDALKYAGFKCCSLANNHFNDYGANGINNSLHAILNRKIDYVGAGVNLEDAQSVLYKDINGASIAIISCCEHEFSIADKHIPGCNPLDPVQLYYSITEAKAKADYVFLIIHGGLEHIQVPQPRMKKLYRYFIDMGVDAVINHHQHCYNGMEVYNGKPIFYGLGNFCFDWNGKRNCMWNYGYIVSLSLDDALTYQVIPYRQCDYEPTISLLEGVEKESFNKSFKALSDIIQNDEQLETLNSEFYTKNQGRYKWIFEPYDGRILTGLYFRKLLPSFAKNNKYVKLNFIDCESHREALLDYLKR